MIYYVTKINVQTGDETVMSSHDNSVAAIAAHSNYSNSNTDEYVRFRIDTVMSTSEEIAEANKRIPKPLVSWAGYRRAEEKRQQRARDELQARLDSDSMRTKDFTREELFQEKKPFRLGYMCHECAALVADGNLTIHVAWHNKLLP